MKPWPTNKSGAMFAMILQGDALNFWSGWNENKDSWKMKETMPMHWQLHWLQHTIVYFWLLSFSDNHEAEIRMIAGGFMIEFCFLTTTWNPKHLPLKCLCFPEVCVQSMLSPIHIAFTVCNEICNINHYYLSCDLDVDIEIEEQIYHRLIWVTMHAA